MAISLWGFIKGILIEQEADRTKQLSVEVHSSATTNTKTTLQSKQTANRTLDLPDVSGTIVEVDATQTLTNKTINGVSNTITNVSATNVVVTPTGDISSTNAQAAFVELQGDIDTLEANKINGESAVTDNAIVRWDGTGGKDVQNSTVTIDDSGNIVVPGDIDMADAKEITFGQADARIGKGIGAFTTPHVSGEKIEIEYGDSANEGFAIGKDGNAVFELDQNGQAWLANDVEIGEDLVVQGDVTIQGDLSVNGTVTSINSANLDVTDKNITMNNGGNDASSEGAGITVERTSTNGTILYENALASKWKAGAAGSEVELANVSSAQTLTNKTIVVANNTVTTAASGNLSATNLNAALAELQTDIDTRATTTDLDNHINDTVDAHDASAISFTPAGSISSTTVQAAIEELSGDVGASAFSTGDAKLTFKTTADVGWVMANDGTIGNASSSGTTRANADTEPLFTLLWDNVSNTYAAVSGGRGASAAADFAANKTIALTKVLGRALAVGGAGSTLTSRSLGETTGAETHSLTAAQNGTHTHIQNAHTHGCGTGDGSNNAGTFFGTFQTNDGGSLTTQSTTPTNQNSGSGDPHNNMQPTSFLNLMIKL